MLKARSLFLELISVIAAPVLFIRDIIKAIVLTYRVQGEVISFSALNSINDLSARITQAHWIPRYGLNGVAYSDYMGNPFNLFYPPLSTSVLHLAGTRFFMALTVAAWIGVFALISLTTGTWISLLAMPYVLCSPYFKNNCIACGRVEMLSWSFVVYSIVFFMNGWTAAAALFFILTVLTHLTPALLGGTVLAAYVFFHPDLLPAFVMVCAATACTTLFWVYPFVKSLGKLGAHEIWNTFTFTDATRTRDILFVKEAGFAVYAAAAAATGDIFLVSIAVFTLVLLATSHEWRIFNRFSVEMFIILNGILVLTRVESPWLCLAGYMIALYVYSRPSSRAGFSCIPHVIGPENEQAVKELLKKVKPYSRFALEHDVREAQDLRTVFKWNEVISYVITRHDLPVWFLSGLGYDSADPSVYLEIERWINARTAPEKFMSVLDRGCVNYVIATSEQMKTYLEKEGFTFVARASCGDIGSLRAQDFYLYKSPVESTLIAPDMPFVIDRDTIRFNVKKGREYRLKMCWFPGWKAFLNSREIPIRDTRPGMSIHPAKSGEVVFAYRYRHYWNMKEKVS